MTNQLNRFMGLVVRRGHCWEWRRAPDAAGYSRFTLDGQRMGAHRASYLLLRGPIEAGLCVLHRCDNRACVNPDHLFLGTKTDNMLDRDAKGRQTKGSAIPWAKLTADDVREIVRCRAAGEAVNSLARRFHIDRAMIWAIVTGRKWKSVTSVM